MSWWNPFKNKKPQPKDISKKFLVVGLGNIGVDYALTRHNLGFDVLNYIAKRKELKFSELRYGAVTKFNFKGRVFVFLKGKPGMWLPRGLDTAGGRVGGSQEGRFDRPAS